MSPADPADDARERMRARLLHDALARGVPWPLAREAVASTALDRDPEVGTYSLEEAP